MKKNILTLLILIISFFSVLAQDDFKYKTEVVPPSPNAAALGSYGGLSPNLVNGAAAVSIPLYSLKADNHEIGLMLTYSSGGFKVDELCTSLGYGWTLQGGGVISRVIYDIPDERGQKIYPPANIALNKPQFNTFLQAARSDVEEEKNTDAQPDQFSFNFMGYSGKFIFDRFMHPVLIEYSNLKIEYIASAYIESFKITAPDGAQYFFTGVETSRTGSSCGVHNSNFRPTSWFLTKAKFTNGEEVLFTYKQMFIQYNMGISQTLYSNYTTLVGCNTGEPCPTLNSATCTNYFDHNTVLLTNISCSSGSIELNYTPRLNALTNSSLQTKGELLSTVVLKNPGGQQVKSFLLEYQNVLCGSSGIEEESRPFLIKLSEKDKQNVTVKHHDFEYNDLAGLPPRLSFSQDHWGYFNGKNNSSLLPKPASFRLQGYYPGATATRDPDETFAKKGLLKKIIYPTGGVEELNYEANTVYTSKMVTANPTTSSTFAQGTGWKTKVVQTGNISIGVDQEIRLTVTVAELDPIDPFYPDYDPIHNIAIVKIADGSNVLYQQTHNAGTTHVEIFDVVAGQQLTITVESYGQLIKTNALIDYIPGEATSTFVNEKVGGVRVSNISLSTSANDQPSKKFFYYYKLSNPQQSSGSANYIPLYNKTVISRISCATAGSYFICTKEAMYSNTMYNLFIYPGSIQYQYVTESIEGPNFENGGIQHTYTMVADSRSFPILGQDIGGVPYQNSSIYSGREIENYIFDKNLNPVQKNIIEYKDDSTMHKDIDAYTVTLKCALPAITDPLWPNDDEIDSYNYSNNKILSRWIYKSRETVYKYSQDGTAFLTDVTDFSYNNPVHALLTCSSHNNSKGGKKIQTVQYVSDEDIINEKAPFPALSDFNQAIATCENTYNAELNAFNNQLSPLVGQMNQLWGSCYSQYHNDCSPTVCTILGCLSPDCASKQNELMEECRQNNGYYTVLGQINTLTQNSTFEAERTGCINMSLTQYNTDINNYNTALSQAIAAATDEHTKAILVMQQKNILNVVLKTTLFRDNLSTELSKSENKYKYWPNEQVNPQYVYQSILGNLPENKMEFLQYDSKGNVLDFKKDNDVVNSFIWDYQKNYPVAKCIGASFNDIAYSSFESDGTGNWSETGTILNNGGATGDRSFNGTLSKTFPTSQDYIVSVWCAVSATVTINGTSGNTTLIRGNWKLIEAKITNTNSIQVSGNNFDEVRAYPAGAQMMTYTYEPLIGITTQCDMNNLITHYEYDAFGRLKLIRDQDNNIIKTFGYQYQQAVN